MAAARCPFGCPSCGRSCTAAAPLSHRFDCCGSIAAHDVVLRSRGKAREAHWVRITNPTRAGYLTGPSRTAPRETSSSNLG